MTITTKKKDWLLRNNPNEYKLKQKVGGYFTIKSRNFIQWRTPKTKKTDMEKF